MTKLIGTAPNQTPTNADLGTMAYQDSNQIKVGTIDAKGKVQATDDVRLVAATSTTRRVNSFVADTAYNLGTSGGAAIAFHRTSDNSDEIGFETHKHGTSHLERFRIGSLGQFGVGGATYGTSGQVLTSGGASAAPTWADAGGGVPAGSVIYHAANTAPTGFLKANGAAVSRTTYSDLFTAIGTTFGAGDGSSTFNVPDLRGEFPRGWDDSRGVDSGRSFGSAQSDQMESHIHGLSSAANFGGSHNRVLVGSGVFSSNNATTTSQGGTSNSSENRPRNIALLACIKY